MKKLLLTSAIVAVAGAASAEVTWSGDAEFGWKSLYDTKVISTADPKGEAHVFAESGSQDSNGLYVDADLDATASTELDNGISASISYGMKMDYAAEGAENFVKLNDFPTLKFESSVGKMTVGDVDHAAHALFDGPDSMVVDFQKTEDELVARLDVEQFGFTFGSDYTIATEAGNVSFGDIGLTAGSTTVGIKGEIAGALFSFGYEADKKNYEYTAFGLSGGYSWNGIRGIIAYSQDNNAGTHQKGGVMWDDSNKSIGFTAGYTMQSGLDLSLGIASNELASGESYMAYDLGVKFNAMGADVDLTYEMSDDDNDDNDGVVAELSYTMESAGVTLNAGYDHDEFNVVDDNPDGAYYVGAEYGLGNGASVFAAYSTGDEFGGPEYYPGASLGVKLEF